MEIAIQHHRTSVRINFNSIFVLHFMAAMLTVLPII